MIISLNSPGEEGRMERWKYSKVFPKKRKGQGQTQAPLVAQMINNLPVMQEIRVQSLGQEDSLK